MSGSQVEEVVEEQVVEVHQLSTVAEETSKRRLVNLQVSLSQAEFPRVEKCCIFFDLRWGLNVWLPIEALIWLFLFISAFCYEIIFAENYDLLDFYDETQEWYFHLIFGDRLVELDQRVRTYIVLINLLLTLIFLTYLAFCLVLLFGINMRKTCFFLPYFVFDAIFSFLALIGCFVGLICFYHHLFRVCFLFLIIKVIVEISVVSLFLKLRHEKSKTPTPIDTSGTIYEDKQTSLV